MNRRYYQLVWCNGLSAMNEALPGEGLKTLAARKSAVWYLAITAVRDLRSIRIYLCLGGRSGLPETYEEISFR